MVQARASLGEGEAGVCGWNGRPVGPWALPASVLSLHIFLPSSSHTHTFQDWGEPETPRTPGQGLPTFPRVGSVCRLLRWRQGLLCYVGTNAMGSTSPSQRGGCCPPWVSPHLLPQGQQQENGVPAVGHVPPLPARSFTHCDFALPPTQARTGQRAHQEAQLGSGSCLS